MNGYLPTSIRDIVDLDTLEPQKDSFINKELQETFSDLLFKVKINNKIGYICFLFEHKSYKDKLVIVQILKYMAAIWESVIKKHNMNELPVIIPLVIYHGKDEWNIKTKYNDDDIKLESITRIIVKIMRDVRYASEERVIEIVTEGLVLLDERIEKDNIIYYLESCFRYILSVRSDIDVEKLIKIADPVSVEGSELVMTIAEKLRQEGR